MISYKYKLYRTKRTRHLDAMLGEACFVWDHALALQKRYCRMSGKFVPVWLGQRPRPQRSQEYSSAGHCRIGEWQ